MINVIVGGDVCPINRSIRHFKAGDASAIFNDLLPEFGEADLCIANLECPLVSEPSPIIKSGPVFGVESSCINGLRESGIDILNLANNHILDHGPQGLKNTLTVCAGAGIS